MPLVLTFVLLCIYIELKTQPGFLFKFNQNNPCPGLSAFNCERYGDLTSTSRPPSPPLQYEVRTPDRGNTHIGTAKDTVFRCNQKTPTQTELTASRNRWYRDGLLRVVKSVFRDVIALESLARQWVLRVGFMCQLLLNISNH